ncbi:uncharacterized protein LOC124267355 [Haliotis rubra]|uniref:uncharacterized protein LOC124267355 n=1 Tax=Haliotis rubra TaxID=36100 RepID=UPI001EE53696|nr:uncharacterized protein LOC124267355 [Haliotis rubra]
MFYSKRRMHVPIGRAEAERQNWDSDTFWTSGEFQNETIVWHFIFYLMILTPLYNIFSLKIRVNQFTSLLTGTTLGYNVYGLFTISPPTLLSASSFIQRFTVGGHSAHKGSGSNMLCAHSEPQFTRTFSRTTGKFNYLYGAEYEQIWRTDLTNEDAPCSVCVGLTRSTATLVPGRHECMEGWRTEYWGFLVGPKHADAGNADYIFLDSEPKATEGSYQDHDGRLLFNVEYQCGALPCPPYKTGFFVPSALCTI